MDATNLAAITGLAGVLLGGGIKTLQDFVSRKAQARAVLSALVSEIDALTRLVNHRQFLPSLIAEAVGCQALIDQGRPDEPVGGIQINLSHDYFSLFNALSEKIGTLDPYQADRIVRFYAVAKAATETLLDRDMAKPIPAMQRLQLLESDIALVQVLLVLGCEVADFRKVEGPATALGPLKVSIPPYQFRLSPPLEPQNEGPPAVLPRPPDDGHVTVPVH